MGVQEVKAQAEHVDGRFERVGGMLGPLPLRREEGLLRRRPVHRKAPSEVITASARDEFDAEGRYVETRYDTARRKFSVISCYFPSGSSGEERQQAKFRFLDRCTRTWAPEGRARVHPGGRRQHRAPGDRPEELEEQPEEQRLPARGARLDEHAARRGGLVDVFRTLNPTSPSSTPGGASAARRGPRTWAGGWTTTWPRRASRPRRGASTSTWPALLGPRAGDHRLRLQQSC
jgi:exodeoxyribonuclease-3